MPTPAATILNTTATGDAVTGPGCPLNLVNGLPVACMGAVGRASCRERV